MPQPKRPPTAARVDAILAGIAARSMGIETLATRLSDDLDFHEVAVWQVRAALHAAFLAGQVSTPCRGLENPPAET